MAERAYDLVIRRGTVVDGGGGQPFVGDVAVDAGCIVAVGVVEGRGREEIEAAGLLVTPGFVDIHTHYDGQATWEHRLAPSSGHGVTTVVTGNCGVGFAPVRPGDHDTLIKVMEGVEDIPEIVMAEGLPWNWESFPDYLDALDARCYDIDVAAQIAHSPLRVYVMGDRGARREVSTEEDRREMGRLVTEAIRAGAVGVSTSRSVAHCLKNGEPAPSVSSVDEELYALARGLRAADGGVFQIIPNYSADPAEELRVIRRIAEISEAPVSFSLMQSPTDPDHWKIMLGETERAGAAGLPLRAQVFPRPVGVLMGLDLSVHPFCTRPSYQAIAHLPLAERVAILRDPAVKAKILAEEPVPDPQDSINLMISMAPRTVELADPVDYAPPPERQIARRAEAAGRPYEDFVYDVLLQDDGRMILYLPGANFHDNKLDAARVMMEHPQSILALGDGGAHYGVICDASFTTYVLTYWVRDAAPDQRFPLEWAIAELTRRPALALGFDDRGLIAPGMKADINIIDHEALTLFAPRTVYNLPAGGRRLQQLATGYVATIVSGEITYRDGEPTGALPGRLVRGRGGASAAAEMAG